MTNPETGLREAAERLRRVKAGEHVDHVYDLNLHAKRWESGKSSELPCNAVDRRYVEDKKAVVSAYLGLADNVAAVLAELENGPDHGEDIASFCQRCCDRLRAALKGK